MSAQASRWYAVHTRPRQEQVALVNLQRQGFECFLPMAEVRGLRGKPRREPLFPRYLFLQADPATQSLASVRSTRGAVGLVRAGFDVVEMPAAIVVGLQDRANPTTGLIELDASALCDGDKVRVCEGPFAALEGVFQTHRGRDRSLLLIEILGNQTAVEVDLAVLQRVS